MSFFEPLNQGQYPGFVDWFPNFCLPLIQNQGGGKVGENCPSVRPRTAAELKKILDKAFGQPTLFDTTGNMAFISVNLN